MPHESGALSALLHATIDYAGLFPPAGLSMERSVENFARYREMPHSWMLGRFIVPVANLEEFERAADGHLPRAGMGSIGDDRPLDEQSHDDIADPHIDYDGWAISALPSADRLDADIDTIFDFNRRHATDSGNGLAVIDTIETKAESAADVDRIAGVVPVQLDVFIEVPWERDPRGMVAAIAGTGAFAKLRTGHVKAGLIPPVPAVAAFIAACDAAGVAFKATAGLHHPVRGERALTYDDDPPRGVMHGFLNVFVASALLRAGAIDGDALEKVIGETDPAAFTFDDGAATWRGRRADIDAIERTRDRLLISFGSCSFTEPVEDLESLKLL